jgi:hypothetical protein
VALLPEVFQRLVAGVSCPLAPQSEFHLIKYVGVTKLADEPISLEENLSLFGEMENEP